MPQYEEPLEDDSYRQGLRASDSLRNDPDSGCIAVLRVGAALAVSAVLISATLCRDEEKESAKESIPTEQTDK